MCLWRDIPDSNSCQEVKLVTQYPFGEIEPLLIPAGPWKDNSYHLIPGQPVHNGFKSIQTVIDQLTKMAHLVPCRETKTYKKLVQFMPQNVWKLQGTQRTFVVDQGSIVTLHITLQLDKDLGIWPQLPMVYHPRTDCQQDGLTAYTSFISVPEGQLGSTLAHFQVWIEQQWEISHWVNGCAEIEI